MQPCVFDGRAKGGERGGRVEGASSCGGADAASPQAQAAGGLVLLVLLGF
jgi:hypothetical protein